MTVKLLRAYGGLAAGDLYDGTADVELELVNAGSATWEQRSSGASGGPGNSSTGGGASAALTRLTSAAFDALVGASGLTVDAEYYITDGPDRRVATSTSTYDSISFVQDGVTYIGGQAVEDQTEKDLTAGTWASRPLTGFDTGIVYYRRMTDIGTTPGGTVMTWLGGTSTEWHLTAPLRMRLRGAGSVTTSAQYPTNTRHPLAAGLMAACARFDVHLKVAQSDETSTLDSWRIKLGSTGTATDATILTPTGTPLLSAGDNQRAWNTSFNIDSSTSIKMDGLSSSANVGWNTAAGSGVETAAVALTGSDDTGDALYLGLDYTMATCNTALTTTVILTLWP